MLNDKTAENFLDDISIEPYILFIGQNFDITNNENQKILSLPWSCVFTSVPDFTMPDSVKNYNRTIRYISNKEGLYNALDKKNLKIVRLFENIVISARQEQRIAGNLLCKINEFIPSIGYLLQAIPKMTNLV